MSRPPRTKVDEIFRKPHPRVPDDERQPDGCFRRSPAMKNAAAAKQRIGTGAFSRTDDPSRGILFFGRKNASFFLSGLIFDDFSCIIFM